MAPCPMGISRTPNSTWVRVAKLLPLRDGNGDSWTTTGHRAATTAAGASWLGESGCMGSEVTGNLAVLDHTPLHWVPCRCKLGRREVCVSHELSQPPPSFPSKKAGTGWRWGWWWWCWCWAAQVAVLAALAGWWEGFICVRGLPLHVVIPSHFHSFPSRRRSISGSPPPKPGWHFSRRGIASCKVASLFQGFSL